MPTSPRKKSVDAFRTISEVANQLGLEQHVLRFWESRFNQIRPMKRGGGRRYYRPEDIALLKRIHGLLKNEGYTIKGVQKRLQNDPTLSAIPVKQAQQNQLDISTNSKDDGQQKTELKTILGELQEIRALIT